MFILILIPIENETEIQKKKALNSTQRMSILC